LRIETDIPRLEALGVPRSLVEEILASGVEAIVVRDGLKGSGREFTLAVYRPFWKIIELNAAVDRVAAAREITRETGVTVEPEEVFRWSLLHELAHHRGVRDEGQADAFAAERLSGMRGYIRRHRVEVDVNLDSISRAIHEEFEDIREGRRR
jgi:hypothetical protein